MFTFDSQRTMVDLQKKTLKRRKSANVQVGYAAPYALYVHENLQASHKVGQAKYLEVPARRLQRRMGSIVRTRLLGKKSLESGLYEAGYLLLTESQKLVPIDTGTLKASGYVRVV